MCLCELEKCKYMPELKEQDFMLESKKGDCVVESNIMIMNHSQTNMIFVGDKGHVVFQ